MKFSIALFISSVSAVTVIGPPVFQSSGVPSGLLSSGLFSNPVQPTASDDTTQHVPTFTLLPPSNPAGTSKPSVITDPAPTTLTGTNGGGSSSGAATTTPAPTGTDTPAPSGTDTPSGSGTGSPSTKPSSAAGAVPTAANLAGLVAAVGLAVAM